MTADTELRCRACGAAREPGQLLRCRPTNGGPEFYVCRPGGVASCIRAAGRRDDARIEWADRASAIEYDRENSVPDHSIEVPKAWVPLERVVWGRNQ
jgi:hypothetical protein